jgi:hypothetical protein
MSQRDSIALGKIDTNSDEAYEFAAEVRELMDVSKGHLPPGTGSFSRDGTSHVDLTSVFFMNLEIEGLSFRHVLMNWLQDKQPEVNHPKSLVEYP